MTRLDISDEERGALRAAHDALHFAAGIAGTNASPGQTRIMDLVRPEDPPILWAFAEELENWPEVDWFLEEVNVFPVYSMNKQGELHIYNC